MFIENLPLSQIFYRIFYNLNVLNVGKKKRSGMKNKPGTAQVGAISEAQ